MKTQLSLSQEDNTLFNKKKNKQFEKVGWFQLLTFWNKNSRDLWKQNKLIGNLIKDRDYSSLFEIAKNGYNFSDKQNSQINTSIAKALADRNYPDKLGIFKLLQKYDIEVSPMHYCPFIVSNDFNNIVASIKDDMASAEEESVCNRILLLLENQDFKKQLHEFIVNDIENMPQHIGAGINWAMNRNAYYQPLNRPYLFDGMSKNHLSRIIKTKIGIKSVIKQYQVLLSQAPIDSNLMKQLGIDTKSLVEKAQKNILLSESSLTVEMKEKINQISLEVEKIQEHNYKDYEDLIDKLSNELLPSVVKKYLSIDEEYRHSLRNIEGKLPSELLMESLENIYLQVNTINQQINEDKVNLLSVDNRKLRSLNKM